MFCSFLNLGAGLGLGGQRLLQPLHPLERPRIHSIEAVRAPAWKDAETLNSKIMRNFVFYIVIYNISHEIISNFSQSFSIISHFFTKIHN